MQEIVRIDISDPLLRKRLQKLAALKNCSIDELAVFFFALRV